MSRLSTPFSDHHRAPRPASRTTFQPAGEPADHSDWEAATTTAAMGSASIERMFVTASRDRHLTLPGFGLAASRRQLGEDTRRLGALLRPEAERLANSWSLSLHANEVGNE